MFGRKSHNKESKSKEKSLQAEVEKISKKDTKYYEFDLKSKPDSIATFDGGARKMYPGKKRDDENEHTYYPLNRPLTEAKIKQDSYSEVKQFYSRKDKIIGSDIPRVKEFTPRKDQGVTMNIEVDNQKGVITNMEKVNQVVVPKIDRGIQGATQQDLPPDYSALFPDLSEGPQ